MIHWEEVGVCLPEILLPSRGEAWAVVACDQFTGQPKYWEDVERLVGDLPSALRITLPEIYLGAQDEERRIQSAHSAMQRYVTDKTLSALPEGGVLVERTVGGRKRLGLVVALDLELYDYSGDSVSLIRATEGTILERIPPRLKIREGACLETPHVIVLIDDPERTVIEPLLGKGRQVYDFDLMCDGGRLTGFSLGEGELDGARAALQALKKSAELSQGTDSPMLYAVGDGNHSLATAKAFWEKLKPTLSPGQSHPARYALVEIENIHDEGIEFEPIHRVLYNAPQSALEELKERMPQVGEMLQVEYIEHKGQGKLHVWFAPGTQAVRALQTAMDALLAKYPDMKIDYIHGEQAVREICAQKGNIGFLLPPISKSDFFGTVVRQGALERKSFSMGHANEKRYYMETRKIVKNILD